MGPVHSFAVQPVVKNLIRVPAALFAADVDIQLVRFFKLVSQLVPNRSWSVSVRASGPTRCLDREDINPDLPRPAVGFDADLGAVVHGDWKLEKLRPVGGEEIEMLPQNQGLERQIQ